MPYFIVDRCTHLFLEAAQYNSVSSTLDSSFEQLAFCATLQDKTEAVG